jgi:SAM-dependent methyltransferase
MSRIRAPYINTFQTQSYEEIFRHNPTDIELFKAIGFSNVFSLDVSPYEGADFVWDLNYPVGNELAGRFDFIYDGGTIEHIFNFPQVLENLHKLLKPEGYIFHESPANNFVDHGFYQFSPSVFHDYYTANGYQIVSSLLCRVYKRKNKSYRAFNYTPVRFEHRSYGGWGRAVLSNVVVVKKLASSSTGLIPQQSRYLEIFWDKRVPITNRNSDGWKKRLATSFPKIRYWYVRLRRPTSEFFSQLRSFYPEKSDFKL